MQLYERSYCWVLIILTSSNCARMGFLGVAMKFGLFRSTVTFSGILFVLAGCSHVDTGQVDYRIAEPPAKQRLSCRGENCDPQSPAPLIRRYLPSEVADVQPIANQEYYSISLEQAAMGHRLLEGSFFGRELGSSVFGDTAEIAVLAKVFEFGASADGAPSFIDNVAGEVGRGQSADAQTNDAEDPLSGLRLIYYSGDVEPRQMLNFSNIPLYTVTEYSGRSVGIQIVVVEVDGDNGATAALFTRLAEFGQQISPASASVLPLLSQLGQSFASGASGDDVLLDYRFVLSSSSATENGAPQLTPGRYVIRRQQERQVPMQWGNMCVDHNTGRLYRRLGDWVALTDDGDNPSSYRQTFQNDNACSPAKLTESRSDGGLDPNFEEVRDEFYMTFRVDNHGKNATAEFIDYQDWTNFRDRISTLAEDRTRQVNELFDSADELIVGYRSRRWRSDLSGQWANAVRALGQYEVRYVSDAQLDEVPGFERGGSLSAGLVPLDKVELERCGVTAFEVRGERDNARNRARSALLSFYDAYQRARSDGATALPGPFENVATTTNAEGEGPVVENAAEAAASENTEEVRSPGEPGFQPAERAAILAMVSQYFIPWSSAASEQNFLTVDTFEGRFIEGNNSADFVNAALGHAELRKKAAPAIDCTGLGLAITPETRRAQAASEPAA